MYSTWYLDKRPKRRTIIDPTEIRVEWPPDTYTQARATVWEANRLRSEYRRCKLDETYISELEPDLLCAFWRYDMHPALQAPAGSYDLDFYFAAERLAVELDGRDHDTRRHLDRKRDKELKERHGIVTMRFHGRGVWRNPLQAARDVRWKLGELRGEPWHVTRAALYPKRVA